MLSFLLATLLATSTFSAAQSGDASTGASFTYPPEDGLTANENTHNFTQNLVFYENQQYVVEWINVTNPDNTLLNLAVWHVFPNQSTIGDLEYVSRTYQPYPTLRFPERASAVLFGAVRCFAVR